MKLHVRDPQKNKWNGQPSPLTDLLSDGNQRQGALPPFKGLDKSVQGFSSSFFFVWFIGKGSHDITVPPIHLPDQSVSAVNHDISACLYVMKYQ